MVYKKYASKAYIGPNWDGMHVLKLRMKMTNYILDNVKRTHNRDGIYYN